MAASQTAPRSKPAKRRRTLRWALELGLVIGIFLAINAWQTQNHLSDAPAPAFELAGLDGTRTSLESLKGKRVLLHFWATWCGVCKLELSSLNAVYDGLAEDEALITVVADSDDKEALTRFIREHELRYPVLLADEAVLSNYRVSAFPTNYFIDEGGEVSSVTVGLSNRIAYRLRLALASQ